MNYDRISSYPIETFFTELARIQLYKMADYVLMPQGIHVSRKMEITVIVPEMVSLHDFLHSPASINGSEEGLSLEKKIALLLELARILSQFHSLAVPFAHGSITSHNIYVDFDPESERPHVRIGELEMRDFKKYANMFYSYRSVSVWSAPECLKQQKKHVDPTWQMDAYSFGILMWEVLYEKIPFEGEVKTAIEYVVDEDARPLILTVENQQEPDSSDLENNAAMVLTDDLANIIRRCWQSDPNQRANLNQVAKWLKEQQAVLFESDLE